MKSLLVGSAVLVAASGSTIDTYRLVQAVGNTEQVSAKGLTKAECERRKAELKATASALGTAGSITCLPDRFFDD